MNPPDVVPDTDITPTSIKLTWSGISVDSDTGRDSAIFYELSWYNDDSSIWEVLNPPSGAPTL
jgi:hypothetical protein